MSRREKAHGRESPGFRLLCNRRPRARERGQAATNRVHSTGCLPAKSRFPPSLPPNLAPLVVVVCEVALARGSELAQVKRTPVATSTCLAVADLPAAGETACCSLCVHSVRRPAPRACRAPRLPAPRAARAWRGPRGTDHRALWFSAAFVFVSYFYLHQPYSGREYLHQPYSGRNSCRRKRESARETTVVSNQLLAGKFLSVLAKFLSSVLSFSRFTAPQRTWSLGRRLPKRSSVQSRAPPTHSHSSRPPTSQSCSACTLSRAPLPMASSRCMARRRSAWCRRSS